MTTLAVCSYCGGTGWGESDYDPGTFYRCSTCNPKGLGKPRPHAERAADDPRLMDRLVATRVLGWKPPKYEHPYARGKRAWTRPKPDDASSRNACYVDLPHFTRDIAAAWMVVDALLAGDFFSVAVSVNHESGWFVSVDYGKAEGEGPTAALAICRAALAAVSDPRVTPHVTSPTEAAQ